MNVGITQSQSQILSAAFSVSAGRTQNTGSSKDGGSVVDVMEVGLRVDAEYVRKVVQDSLQERLNAAFEAAGMDTTVEDLLASGMDASPEATAQRIVEFSVSFFDAFKSNNEGEEPTGQLEEFVSLIKGAIEEGFAEAGEILSGIGQISQQVQAGIDETFELTMKGIDEFVEQQRQALADQQEVLADPGEQQEVGVL